MNVCTRGTWEDDQRMLQGYYALLVAKNPAIKESCVGRCSQLRRVSHFTGQRSMRHRVWTACAVCVRGGRYPYDMFFADFFLACCDYTLQTLTNMNLLGL